MSHHWGYVNALIAAALFGISATLNKIVLNNIHPLVVSGLIYFSAGVLLSLFSFFPFYKEISKRFKIYIKEKKLEKRDWFYLIFVALSGGVIGPFLFLYGLNISTAVNASLLLNTEALFTILIAVSFLKEVASKKDCFAMLLLFVSALIITTNLNFSGFNLSGNFLGNLFIVAGTLFWAIDNSLSKKLSIKNNVVKIASLKSLIGGSIVLLIAAVLGMPFNISLVMIPYILFVGFFSFGISIVLFLSALRIIGSMKTIVIFSTASLFGVISAFFVLKEPISLVQLTAGIIMVFAVYLMSKKPK